MLTITRKFEFDAGHRILRHESKCAHLHGHRYVAEVTIQAPELDSVGRVIDFGQLKTIIGGWIDENWDHNIILNPDDPLLAALRVLGREEARQAGVLGKERALPFYGKAAMEVLGDKAPFLMPKGQNPTVEHMAKFLCTICVLKLQEPILVTKVRLFETPNCWAEYDLHSAV